MRDDLIGVAVGTVLFAFLLVPPGYAFGWLFNLFDFRKQSWPAQLGTSLVLSIAMVPILDFLLWDYISIYAVWAFYAATGIICVFLSIQARKSSIPRWTVSVVFAWLLIAWLSGIDLQFGDRLFPSVLSYDYNLRSALISGLARDGLPARNPLFYPGHPQPLRYHYFWLIPCALVDLLGGKCVNARQALVASDVWCGWALMLTVALYLRFLHPAGERGFASRAKWGVLMLAVAGLDILPNAFFDSVYAITKSGPVFPSSEWWNYPVTGFPHATLWVAHHVAGVVACLAGFLLLWWGTKNGRGNVWKLPICSGFCFASAVGLSIYVTFAFGIFLVVWAGGVTLIRRQWRESLTWVATGVVTFVCALPYLRSLISASGPGPAAASAAGRFVMPTIRSLRIFDLVLPQFGFGTSQIAFANFLVLPLNYFLETGVWFVLAVLWWKRAIGRRKLPGEAELAALTMFAVSLLVGTFLRSGVIANNDLGWRSLLIAQVILVTWSVGPLRAWWRLRSRPVAGLSRWRLQISWLVALGLISTAYELMDLRLYLPMTAVRAVPEVAWFGSDSRPGRRTYDARVVYQKLDQLLPKDAVIQANPIHWSDMYHGLYGVRQTASFDAGCGVTFGGSGDCQALQNQLAPLFNDRESARQVNIDRVCDAWGINALIAKDDDPVFADHTSWAWTKPTIVVRERVRAIPCGTSERQNGLTSRPSAATVP